MRGRESQRFITRQGNTLPFARPCSAPLLPPLRGFRVGESVENQRRLQHQAHKSAWATGVGALLFKMRGDVRHAHAAWLYLHCCTSFLRRQLVKTLPHLSFVGSLYLGQERDSNTHFPHTIPFSPPVTILVPQASAANGTSAVPRPTRARTRPGYSRPGIPGERRPRHHSR